MRYKLNPATRASFVRCQCGEKMETNLGKNSASGLQAPAAGVAGARGRAGPRRGAAAERGEPRGPRGPPREAGPPVVSHIHARRWRICSLQHVLKCYCSCASVVLPSSGEFSAHLQGQRTKRAVRHEKSGYEQIPSYSWKYMCKLTKDCRR